MLFAYPRFILLCAGLRFPKTLFWFVYFSSLFRVKTNVCKLRSYIYFIWTYLLLIYRKEHHETSNLLLNVLVIRPSSNKESFKENVDLSKIVHAVWNVFGTFNLEFRKSDKIYSVPLNSNLLINIFFSSF